MKKFDWSILFPVLGGGVLVVGSYMNLPTQLVVIILAALLFLMFVTALFRFAKLHSLEADYHELQVKLELAELDYKQDIAKMKSAQEKEQTEFFNEISHSLRMPVSIIQGYAELMQAGSLDPVTESEYLEKIVQHTHRMTDTLSGHMGSGQDKVAAVPKQVELVKSVQQQLDDMNSAAAGRGISLQLVSSEDSLLVNADPRLLQRVLFNLVENAINYMGREGMVSVILTREENMARICVRDDGLGLPEEEVARMFEPHFQGSNASPGKGSGHGLFMVKRSVEAQGGCVSAVSTPGRGMSVIFTLPLVTEPSLPS